MNVLQHIKSTFSLKIQIFIILFSVCVLAAKNVSANNVHDENLQRSPTIGKIDSQTFSPSSPHLSIELLGDVDSTGPLELRLSYFALTNLPKDQNWNEIETKNLKDQFIGLHNQSLAIQDFNSPLNVEIKRNIVAKIKKEPVVILGELYAIEGNRLISQQFNFKFPNPPQLIQASALAFDNPNYSAGNLAPQTRETIKGIAKGTENNPNLFSVALADEYGMGNSNLYFVYDGHILSSKSFLNGLPDISGNIQLNVNELDMGAGETLGGFIQSVRKTNAPSKLSFSFYGHGSALMPEIETGTAENLDIAPLSGSGPVTLPSWVAVQPSWVAVQPSWVAVQPSWVAVQPTHIRAEENFATDANSLSIISVKDLAKALEIGTDGGANKIDVLDLVHCFSLTIEEIHELVPFTNAIVGSANYHFFDSRMPGAAAEGIDAGQSPVEMADTIMRIYDQVLPSEKYPRTMAVVDSPQVQAIKASWDQVSQGLLSAFEANSDAARTKLHNAYTASTKYDTTSCDGSIAIQAPDALVDFHQFATQLQIEFADNQSISNPALETASQIDKAIYSVINRSETPWFASGESEVWEFSGKGLALYADLVGMQDAEGKYRLTWQSAFYNRAPHDFSQNPFAFLTSDSSQATWADVLVQNWEGYEVYIESCLVNITPPRDQAELVLTGLDYAANTSTSAGQLFIHVNSNQNLGNLNVLIEVKNGEQLLQTEMVQTGWIESGLNTVSIDSLVIDRSAEYDVNVWLDPNGYIEEADRTDNYLKSFIQ